MHALHTTTYRSPLFSPGRSPALCILSECWILLCNVLLSSFLSDLSCSPLFLPCLTSPTLFSLEAFFLFSTVKNNLLFLIFTLWSHTLILILQCPAFLPIRISDWHMVVISVWLTAPRLCPFEKARLLPLVFWNWNSRFCIVPDSSFVDTVAVGLVCSLCKRWGV